MVETKMIQGAAYSKEDMEKDKEKYVLGRYGHPEEVAYAIVYLLSDASRWVTGTSLVIDGGRLLH
jgi:NAD(P)-dependent dehydrogenase (short-subunit alcohol dehydrogenase family)